MPLGILDRVPAESLLVPPALSFFFLGEIFLGHLPVHTLFTLLLFSCRLVFSRRVANVSGNAPMYTLILFTVHAPNFLAEFGQNYWSGRSIDRVL